MFLPATGNANSNELGGVPADQFLLGNGVSQTVSVGSEVPLPLAGGTAYALFNCTSTGLTPVAAFTIESVTNNAQAWRLNKDGEGYATLNQGQNALLAQSDTAPYAVVVQVASAAGGAATADLFMAVDDSAQTCSFAAQSASGD